MLTDELIVGGGTATATPAQAVRYLLDTPGCLLTEAEAAEIVWAFQHWGAVVGIRWDRAFAMSCHETRRYLFGNQVALVQRNPAGIGATNDGAPGLTFPTWVRGIGAMFIHLLAWCDRLDLAGRIDPTPQSLDPRVPLVVQVRASKGKATTWASLAGRWAVPGTGYAQGIERHHAAILALPKETPSMATPKEATDRMIATLRKRGRTVDDLRGTLPINRAHPYGLVRGGLGGVKKLIQHWTGDAFSRATIKAITGTDYGGDTFPEAMSREDEIDALAWYAKLHIARDGGTWGGIAYGVVVFPSGRTYVNWDIGTLTYHAFSVNGYSYAICSPASNGQAPTKAALVSLNHIWQVLCEETPEIPAGWGDLYGHSEAKQFDGNNQTSCPGPGLLAHVQQARATKAPSVPLAILPPPPPVSGNPWPMLDPVVIPSRTYPGRGRLVSVETTVVNDSDPDNPQYYSIKDRYEAGGMVTDPWREV